MDLHTKLELQQELFSFPKSSATCQICFEWFLFPNYCIWFLHVMQHVFSSQEGLLELADKLLVLL
jgi:hypothetical protein